MSVWLYKDGDRMGLETDARCGNEDDAGQFDEDFAQCIAFLIEEGAFQCDWFFQLSAWLPMYQRMAHYIRTGERPTSYPYIGKPIPRFPRMIHAIGSTRGYPCVCGWVSGDMTWGSPAVVSPFGDVCTYGPWSARVSSDPLTP